MTVFIEVLMNAWVFYDTLRKFGTCGNSLEHFWWMSQIPFTTSLMNSQLCLFTTLLMNGSNTMLHLCPFLTTLLMNGFLLQIWPARWTSRRGAFWKHDLLLLEPFSMFPSPLFSNKEWEWTKMPTRWTKLVNSTNPMDSDTHYTLTAIVITLVTLKTFRWEKYSLQLLLCNATKITILGLTSRI